MTPEKEAIQQKFNETIKRNILDNPSFKRMQESIKQAKVVLQKTMKGLTPAMNQFKNLYRPIVETEDRYSLVNYRPVEYHILDELRELNRKKSTRKIKTDSEIIIVRNRKENSLERIIDGKKFSYALADDGKRRKLIDILMQNKVYVKTDELKDNLDCPTNDAVSKMVQTLNYYADGALHLKGTKLIKGKRGSGYRINPNIVIEKQ